MEHPERVSTGLEALDEVIQYLRMGDNVVFQVREIESYRLVSFSEINQVSILGELGYTQSGYIPEVSFGTHFFQDMIKPSRLKFITDITTQDIWCFLTPS